MHASPTFPDQELSRFVTCPFLEEWIPVVYGNQLGGLGSDIAQGAAPTFGARWKEMVRVCFFHKGLRIPRCIFLRVYLDMAPKIKRVAVIGAGPSGGIGVDALAKAEAFDVLRVFERKAKVGGTW